VFFFDKLTTSGMKHYGSKSIFKDVSQGLVKNVIRGIIIGLGVLIFMDMIGISITPILASLGIGSLAVALALQETLSNLFAGIYMAIDKPVRVGDYIKLENGDEGYVTDVTWRSTKIRTLPNNIVIVPNKKIMESIITNFYLPDTEMAVLVQMGVHYNSDLEKVEKIVSAAGKEIMKKVQGGVPEFDPFIRFHTFADSSINFTVILRGKEYVDQHLIKHEFMKLIVSRFRSENIIIPFPIRSLDVPADVLNNFKIKN
jgi:small-conductance mechanosensitive channel